MASWVGLRTAYPLSLRQSYHVRTRRFSAAAVTRTEGHPKDPSVSEPDERRTSFIKPRALN